MPQNFLPVLGTILGNDYISRDDLVDFFNSINIETKRRFSLRHKTIYSVLKWLSTMSTSSPHKIIQKVFIIFSVCVFLSVNKQVNSKIYI